MSVPTLNTERALGNNKFKTLFDIIHKRFHKNTYRINNIEVRIFISDTLLSTLDRKCGSVVRNARIFTMCTPFRAASIQTQLLTTLDTIIKLRVFEIGDREIAAGGELVCNIFTTDSVVAAY